MKYVLSSQWDKFDNAAEIMGKQDHTRVIDFVRLRDQHFSPGTPFGEAGKSLPCRAFDVDGEHIREPRIYSGHGPFRMQYVAGPILLAHMEKRDHLYLNAILKSDPRLFLKEMTDRTSLSPSDQRAQLGLDLSLPYHRELQREYAEAISQAKFNLHLMFVWAGKYREGDSVPTFNPVAPKESGASVGFVAAKEHTKPDAVGDCKLWMAKFGMPDATVEATESMTSRGRDQQRTVITSIKEKIAADVYAIIGHKAFYVPKHRLASLPVLNEYTREHLLALAMMEQINRGRAKDEVATHGVHLMSKLIKDYQDLDQLKDCVMGGGKDPQDFMECLRAGHVPEQVIVDGKAIPLIGLMEILAISRLLADTDVLGGGGKNAGFVIERDRRGQAIAVRMVKIDAGEAFNFDGGNNQLIQSFNRVSRAQKLKDKKDIQFGNMQALVINWERLSRAQQRTFIQTLHKGREFLTDPSNLDLLIRRKGEFDKAAISGRPLLTTKMIEEFKEHWTGYIELQTEAEVYGKVRLEVSPPSIAAPFAAKRFGAVDFPTVETRAPAGGAGAGAGSFM